MNDPLSLRLERKQTQSLKQTQKLIMSPQMQQAIKLLQLPILELEQLIDHELEQNPLLEVIDEYDTPDEVKEELECDEELIDSSDQELEFGDENFKVLQDLDEYFDRHFSETENYCLKRSIEEEKKKSFFESNVQATESIRDLLLAQSREVLETPEQLLAAYCLIGNLDASGLLTTNLEEIALLGQIPKELLLETLKEIQTFDPPGIAARDVRECLLIQLKRRGLKESLSYQIVDEYYEDLLHNRVKIIARGLKRTEKEVALEITQKLSKLDLQPGTLLSDNSRIVIIPDIQIISEGDELKIMINNEYIPDLQVSKQYLDLSVDPSASDETKNFIKQKIYSAKWLMRNIMQRSDTLERLARKLVESQHRFFTDSYGRLVPMTMKKLAEELELHESTIARAVANKYLSCNRGVFSLRYFFTNALERDNGELLSSTFVKDLLADLIDKENKKKPFSDDALSKLLKKKGIQCARRTVAKYRTQLNIGNTVQRKQYL
jgi:RNA polymerase sigma-54 factor